MEGVCYVARYSINTSAPNLSVICFDSLSPVKGKLFHCYSGEGIPLDTADSVIEIIDDLCNDLDYPQQTVRTRSFLPNPENNSTQRKKNMKKVINQSELTEKRGDEGTFIVHVQYRENATWQGQVTWVDREQTQNFRSALELLKLIDGALDATAKKKGEGGNEK